MRRWTMVLAALGAAAAVGGIAEFTVTGRNAIFLPWNNLLAVAATREMKEDRGHGAPPLYGSAGM